MAFCAQHHIAHRDVKLSNIIFPLQESPQEKGPGSGQEPSQQGGSKPPSAGTKGCERQGLSPVCMCMCV